jgi:hypothetical protein
VEGGFTLQYSGVGGRGTSVQEWSGKRALFFSVEGKMGQYHSVSKKEEW